jgi:hypothetical protein
MASRCTSGQRLGIDWFRDPRRRTDDRQLSQPRWQLWNTPGIQREQQWIDRQQWIHRDERIGHWIPRGGNDGLPERLWERQPAWNDAPPVRLFVGELTARRRCQWRTTGELSRQQRRDDAIATSRIGAGPPTAAAPTASI